MTLSRTTERVTTVMIRGEFMLKHVMPGAIEDGGKFVVTSRSVNDAGGKQFSYGSDFEEEMEAFERALQYLARKYRLAGVEMGYKELGLEREY